jgi:hypothetical protein
MPGEIRAGETPGAEEDRLPGDSGSGDAGLEQDPVRCIVRKADGAKPNPSTPACREGEDLFVPGNHAYASVASSASRTRVTFRLPRQRIAREVGDEGSRVEALGE